MSELKMKINKISLDDENCVFHLEYLVSKIKDKLTIKKSTFLSLLKKAHDNEIKHEVMNAYEARIQFLKNQK